MPLAVRRGSVGEESALDGGVSCADIDVQKAELEWQRSDLKELQADIEDLDKLREHHIKLREHHIKLRDHHVKVRKHFVALRDRVDRMELMLEALFVHSESKGDIDKDTLRRIMRELDAADGKQDGRLRKRSS